MKNEEVKMSFLISVMLWLLGGVRDFLHRIVAWVFGSHGLVLPVAAEHEPQCGCWSDPLKAWNSK